jgi:hypothetical protein
MSARRRGFFRSEDHPIEPFSPDYTCDLRPLADVVPVHRGGWQNPVYYDLLRRSIRWGIGSLEQ